MSYRSKSTTIFLRPNAYINRNDIRNAAAMYAKRNNWDFHKTILWIVNAQNKRPFYFKNLMAAYYESTEYQSKYKTLKFSNGFDINWYQTSNDNTYGNEPHMHF